MNELTTINPGAPEAQDGDPMPHSIEAEQQLLGAILTNNDIFDRVASIIDASHFYDPVHARIYEVAAARIAKNNLASPVTLKPFLRMTQAFRNWAARPISRVWPVLRSLPMRSKTMRR